MKTYFSSFGYRDCDAMMTMICRNPTTLDLSIGKAMGDEEARFLESCEDGDTKEADLVTYGVHYTDDVTREFPELTALDLEELGSGEVVTM